MGKKDKHKAGQSRNHPVFKVMGNTGKVANKAKVQKTQEVKTKLKKVKKLLAKEKGNQENHPL